MCVKVHQVFSLAWLGTPGSRLIALCSPHPTVGHLMNMLYGAVVGLNQFFYCNIICVLCVYGMIS